MRMRKFYVLLTLGVLTTLQAIGQPDSKKETQNHQTVPIEDTEILIVAGSLLGIFFLMRVDKARYPKKQRE